MSNVPLLWMALLMQWTWTWANSRRWWGTGRPDVLQSMGSQRVGLDLATEQQQWYIYIFTHTHTHIYSHLLYLSICWWTLSLHPCLAYCKQCCYEHWGACIVQVKCLWALTDPIDILLCSNWTKILGISLNDVSVWNALPSMSPLHLPWLPLCLCVCVSVCDSPLWCHLVPHSLLVHSIDAYCIPGTV